MDQLRYDGRVAVVTGAGGGLGKAYALLLASRGAKVVVNDLGGGRDGLGKSQFADAVVKEIKAKGGEAVADYNSVVEGEKIIKTALDNYGRVDILINNAGILRDKSFLKMSEQDWDLIQAVHVKGAFKTTQAAWESFKKQNYGRVIMTSSNAGLIGNFGQANYSTAKMGLVGLANTLAIEGAKNNIKVNTIVPTAASRLTEDILPPEMFKAMTPELIAPVVAYMVHESFPDTNVIIDSTLGFASKAHLVKSVGAPLRKKPADPVTVESVKERWSEVVNMKDAQHVERIADVTIGLVQKLQEFEDRAKMDNDRESYWSTYQYNSKDLVCYALGVGASVVNPTDLKFLYESHEEFSPLPTFFILPGMVMESPVVSQSMPPGKYADFTNILHGEQYIEFVGETPGSEGKFSVRNYVVDMLDKGSSAIGIVNSEIYQNNELVIRTQQHIFVVGQGGFGGPRTSSRAVGVLPPPKRAPDAQVEQRTAEDQAALYRLSGDLNPLHIDPNIATASGHPKPILHGLASLGFSARHVLVKYGGNDSSNVKAIKARFAKPVLPGHTLITEMWLEGNKVHFQSKVKDTGNVVISGAYMDLKKIVKDSGSQTSAPSQEAQSSGVSLKSDALFNGIAENVKANPDKAKSVGAVFLYNITENGKTVKQWTLDLKTNFSVYQGEPKTGKADTTLTVSDSDFLEIAAGTLSPQVAYMKGKLKIAGNMMLAQKLGPLLKPDEKASVTPKPISAGVALKSDALFNGIAETVKANPDKAKSVGAVFLYNITENGKTVKKWTLDFKTSCSVYEGEPKTGKADTTLTVSDSDFLDIASGTLSPQVAYMKGKLKIAGNMMLAQKLGPLLKPDEKEAAKNAPQAAAPSQATQSSGVALKSDSLFNGIAENVKANPAKAKSVGAVFLYNITENGKTVKQWTLDFKSSCSVYQGEPKTGKADTTLTVSDSDFLEIAAGTLSPQVAYMKGKLKIAGNMMLAQKLGPLLKPDSKI